VLGTQLNLSMAYHLETYGKTERVNQVMEDMLRMYVMEDMHCMYVMLWKTFLCLSFLNAGQHWEERCSQRTTKCEKGSTLDMKNKVRQLNLLSLVFTYE
jgi:hypothetical protein